MRFNCFLFLSVLISFSLVATAQDIQSFIDISCDKGECRVSGVLPYEAVRLVVVTKLTQRLGGQVRFKIKILESAVELGKNWEADFDGFIRGIRPETKGIYSFRSKSPSDPSRYPELPLSLQQKSIRFLDGRTIGLGELGKGPIVLVFFEPWAGSAGKQIPTLNSIHKRYATVGVRVIGISTDDQPRLLPELSKYAKRRNILFDVGWADKQMFELFAQISKFPGIPQSFVIFNGHLRGVFVGASTEGNARLLEFVASLATDQNGN